MLLNSVLRIPVSINNIEAIVYVHGLYIKTWSWFYMHVLHPTIIAQYMGIYKSDSSLHREWLNVVIHNNIIHVVSTQQEPLESLEIVVSLTSEYGQSNIKLKMIDTKTEFIIFRSQY